MMIKRVFENFLSLGAIVTALIIVGCAQNRERTGETQPTFLTKAGDAGKFYDLEIPTDANALEQIWGIKVESTRLSAGGYMVDFRYRVLDVNKAAPILDRRVKPYLVDQASGAVFVVPNPPKVGQLRSGKNIKEGKIYFIFFANPGRYVKSGNKVAVVIGDCKITDVVVQ
jgi:hypothetical protein